MKRAAVTRRLIGLLLLAGGHPSAGFAQDALQPYQLVRSLQLIQDRIA
ncbi:chemotaxis protein MotC, partial [Mesorhizobium sp. M7A.F.Ca.CA.004.09.1.2]